MVVEGFSGEHPSIVTLITNARFQAVFAGLSLCIILLLIVTFYNLRPYDGMEMDFHGDNFLWATVDAVYADGPADKAGIVTGDRVLAVNNRSFHQRGNVTVYPPGLGSGDRVSYELLHGQQTFILSFAMGSYFENIPLLGKIIGLQFLALAFWGSGVMLCLLTPHYDVRSRLIGLL